MASEILKLTMGLLQTNCYLVGDTATGQALVIDPVDRAPLIMKTAHDRGWSIRHILATHGHFDHILASAELKMLTGSPFYVHSLDLPAVRTMREHVREWLSIDVPAAAEPDRQVSEGDTISAGSIQIDVLHTPGHSPGHVSYVLRGEGTVFSGDVLFCGAVGRTDLDGGNHGTLMRSIVDKLLPLGDAVRVMPGHMSETTIGYERANNPYIVDFLNVRR